MVPRPLGSSNEAPQHRWAYFACESEKCDSGPASENEQHGSTPDKDANALRTTYGSSGNTFVLTNYVKIRTLPSQIHHYKIQVLNPKSTDVSANSTSMDRKIGRLNEKRRVFKAAVKRLSLNEDTSTLWATDYTNIWVTKELDSRNMRNAKTNKDGDIMLPDVDAGQLGSGEYLNISPMPPLKLPRGHLDIGTVSTDKLSANNAISALNAMVNRRLCESEGNDDIFQVGPNRFFMPHTAQTIRGGCETMRGYFTSVRPGVSELFMNVNTATAAFYSEITVAEFMIQMKNTCKLPYDQVDKYLEGVRVHSVLSINVPEEDENTIAGLGDAVKNQRYWKAGIPTSFSVYKEYMEASNKQRRPLKYAELPCVNVGTQPHKDFLKSRNPGLNDINGTNPKPGLCRARWVPPEYLMIVPHQLFKKPLLAPQTKDMISKARRLPADNVMLIVEEGLQRIIKAPSGGKDLLSADKKLIRVPAEILKAPALQMQILDKTQLKPFKLIVNDGSWNLSEGSFICRGVIPDQKKEIKAGLVRVLFANDPDGAAGFEELLRKQVENLSGLQLATFARRSITVSINDPTKIITQVEESLKNLEDSDLVVFILPRADLDIYAAIKKVGDYSGRHTLCCVLSKCQEKKLDYCANVAMKINLKFNGENHHVHGKVFDKLHDSKGVNTIIIGADVTHPSSVSTPGCPSVAAVVSNVDGKFSTYSASSRLQAGRKELITNLEYMVKERIVAWVYTHRRLPENILYYRDGVSESQYTDLRNDEGHALLLGWEYAQGRIKRDVKKDGKKKKEQDKKLQDIDISTQSGVNITIVVVGKRHHTRFYPVEKSQSYRHKSGRPWDESHSQPRYNGNCQPGLVVDRVIANPYVFDFFLQSHHAIVGTARPAHYYVLQNHMNLTPREIESITHALCYTYQRATKAISYCAPAYLADKLCDRTRCYIRGWLTGRVDIARPKKDNEGHGAWLKRVADEEMEDERGLWNTAVTGDKATVRAEGPWSSKIDDAMFWL